MAQCKYCGRHDCRPGRPRCPMHRKANPKWELCNCGAYHYTHRKGSGICYHAKDSAKKQWEKISGTSWETGEPITG